MANTSIVNNNGTRAAQIRSHVLAYDFEKPDQLPESNQESIDAGVPIDKKFGEWVVSGNLKTTKSYEKSGIRQRPVVPCKCLLCGEFEEVRYYSLINGKSTRCKPCAAKAMKRA